MKLRLMTIGLVIAGGFAAGCESDATGEREVWSTKSGSVLASDLRPSTLKVFKPGRETTSLGAMRDAAVEVLLQAADSDLPLLRANAIEAMHGMPQYLGPLVREGLLDPNRGVRFVAAMTVGKQQMGETAHLVEPLLRDDSSSVRAAAIYALQRCGHEVDLTPLAGLLFMDDAEVRGNVAMILGELGNASAVPMLRAAAQRPLTRADPARKKIVDLQIAEAMVRLGARDEIEVIRAALFAPPDQGEIAALACQIAGRLCDGQALPNLLDMATREGRRRQSAEIRMAATLAVARIDPTRAPLDVPREYLHSDRMALRAQAALTLGMAGRPDVAGHLGPMLSDADPLVQVSAAGAILRLRGETG